MPSQITGNRSTVRSKAFLALLWLGFAGLWFRVSHQTRIHDVGTSLELLLGLVVLYGVMVAIWVGHNVSLARRRNRRRASKEVALFPSRDYLGLPVDIRSNLLAEQDIDITIVDGVKRYSSDSKKIDLALLGAVLPAETEEAVQREPVPTSGGRE